MSVTPYLILIKLDINLKQLFNRKYFSLYFYLCSWIACCKKKIASTIDKVLNYLLDILGLEMLECVSTQNQIITLFDLILDYVMLFKSPVLVTTELCSMMLNVLAKGRFQQKKSIEFSNKGPYPTQSTHPPP